MDELSLTLSQSQLFSNFSSVPTSDEVWLPKIVLAQGLSPRVLTGEVRPGTFVLPDGTSCKDFYARILGVRRARVLRSDDADRQLLCWSKNGVVGEGQPGGNCEECPLSRWTQLADSDGGKREPPKCTLLYQYLVQYDADGGRSGLAVYSVSTRSGSAFVGQVNALVAWHGQGKVTILVKSSLVTKGKKQFYVPVVGAVSAEGSPQPLVKEVEDDEDVPF